MVEVRFIDESEIAEFRRAFSTVFGEDDPDDEAAVARFRAIFPLETSIGAFDRGRVVGTFGSFDLQLTVPGAASLPMAGTTVVTVNPTHRRQGLLTEMMSTHLDQAIDRGQPLAGLWASEEGIYGRFGYGPACHGHELTVPGTVSLPPGPPDVAVRQIDDDEARAVLPPLYQRAAVATPGLFRRSAAWWQHRHLDDVRHRRPSGTTGRRYVVAERDDEAVGYVVYRHRPARPGDTSSAVTVTELVAGDDGVRRALWHFLVTVDLFPTVEWWNAPIDDPVLVEADHFRRIGSRVIDTLWLRLLDVRRALEARHYEQDGSIVIGVVDPFLDRADGFELAVSQGIVRCSPSTTSPDVQLDVADLGSLYLGDGSALTLARAGRITGAEEAVALLDRLFRTAMAPYCIEVF